MKRLAMTSANIFAAPAADAKEGEFALVPAIELVFVTTDRAYERGESGAIGPTESIQTERFLVDQHALAAMVEALIETFADSLAFGVEMSKGVMVPDVSLPEKFCKRFNLKGGKPAPPKGAGETPA